jgi:hypothetical protein
LAEVAPPKIVDVARGLWIASALLGLTQVLIDLSDREMLVAEIRRQDSKLSQDDVDAAVQAGMLFTLLFAALFVLVYTKLANRMAWGRNWARVVLTIIGAGSVLFGLLQVGAHTSGLASALNISAKPLDLSLTAVGMGLDSTAIVLMYVPAAAAHFKRRVSVDRLPDQP